METKPVIDFSRYVEEKAYDFTGREWVFQAVDEWIGDQEKTRFFLMTGDPGSGKSAIAARLKQFSDGSETVSQGVNQLKSNFISAAHFCSARDRRWINPGTFAESLAIQLSARYPEFAKALAEKSGDRQIRIEVSHQIGSVANGQVAGVIINNLDVSGISPEDAFIRVVREPVEALFNSGFDESVIILVDALDESLLYSGDVGIVSLLAHAESLPESVRFIMTSRRNERVENAFLDAGGLFLSDKEFDMRNLEDIDAYIKKRFIHDKQLSRQTSKLSQKEMKKLLHAITGKASGNFQYVSFLLSAAAQGKRSLTEMESLPEGLDGLYHDSIARLVKTGQKDWLQDYASILGVLSVAQEGLTAEQLTAYTGHPESVMWSCLGDLQQFMEEPQDALRGPYLLYHQSFNDFLHQQYLITEKRKLRNSYYLQEQEWHRRISDYYWKNYHENWKECDEYGLSHVVNHLQACVELAEESKKQSEDAGKLYAIVLDKDFQDAHRDLCGDISGTLNDLRTALEVSLKQDELVSVLEIISAYRERIATEGITQAIFNAVKEGDFSHALEKGSIYYFVLKPSGEWASALQLYVAWEAAESGAREVAEKAVARIVEIAGDKESKLCDALLVRIAQKLSDGPGGINSPREWLTTWGRNQDADNLLAFYVPSQPLSPAEEQQVSDDLSQRLSYLEQTVLEKQAEGIFMEEERAGFFASELQQLLTKLSAHPSGLEAIDRALKVSIVNPYPRYRNIALSAIGVACLSIPDLQDARNRLHRILATALDHEGITYTFDLPSVLLAEAGRRKIKADELSGYVEKACQTDDRWGTAARAQSARAIAFFAEEGPNKALEEVERADREKDIGMAGYATLTLLSFADRCFEMGRPEHVSAPLWGSNKDILLLDGADGVARRVRDPKFREERISLVETYLNWSEIPTAELKAFYFDHIHTLSAVSPDVLMNPVARVISVAGHDGRMAFLSHLSARLSYPPDNPDWQGLKALLPLVLMDGTTLDAVLGRVFRVRMQQLTDDEVVRAVDVSLKHLATSRPWEFGDWR